MEIPNKTESIEEIEKKERDALQVLKGLIQADESLKDLPLKDDFLLILLRSRFCKPDAALRTMKTLIEYKEKTYPELFSKVRPEFVKHILDKRFVEVVKRQNDSGPAVMVFRTQKWNTSEATMDDLITAGMLYSYEVAISSVEIQRKGIILLIDVGGFGFSHARQCTYSSVMKMSNTIIFGAPIRIRGCSLIHSPYIFEKVYQVVKFAIPEKYRSYVKVTKTDMSHLHDLISPEVLPESLGGKIPENEGWETSIENSIFENEAVYKFICQISPFLNKDQS